MQVATARLAEHLIVLADQLAAQESGLYARRKLDALERRVALGGLRILRADSPAVGGVDQCDVGIEPFGDVALRVQAEAPRRVEARQRRHAVIGQAALAAL